MSAQQLGVADVLQRLVAEFDIRHPQNVLVVAQAADTVLDVRFLKINGVAGFGVSLLFVAEALQNVRFRILFFTIIREALLHVFVQRGGAANDARLQNRILGLNLVLGLLDH